MSKIDTALEQIKELDDYFTERIKDMHDVKGLQQARHVYIFYRKLLWEIRDTLRP